MILDMFFLDMLFNSMMFRENKSNRLNYHDFVQQLMILWLCHGNKINIL